MCVASVFLMAYMVYEFIFVNEGQPWDVTETVRPRCFRKLPTRQVERMDARDFQVLFIDNLPWKLDLSEGLGARGCHHVQETDRGQVKWWRFLRHKGDRNMLVRQLMAGVLTLSAYVGYCAETERIYMSLHALSQRMVGSVSWPKNQYITVRALVQRMHKRVCDRMGVTIRSTLKARLGLGWFEYMFGRLFVTC